LNPSASIAAWADGESVFLAWSGETYVKLFTYGSFLTWFAISPRLSAEAA